MHAWSSLRGLHVLGNSVWGLDFNNWRTVFHAIILPVLLYGFPVWSHRAPKSLIKIFQIAQNDAVHRISGTFRTMPVEPLHNMLSIPPFKFTLAKYRAAYTARITRLPPSALLRTLPLHDPSAIYIPPQPIPTLLTSLIPASFPPHFFIPSNVTWMHAQVHNVLVSPPSDARKATIVQIANNNPPANHTSIHIYPTPHPDHFVVAFLTFQQGSVIAHGWRASHDCTAAAAEVAIAGVLSLGPHPGLNTLIFVPNHTLHKPLFSLTKHKHLPQASHFTSTLQMLCSLHPSIEVTVLPLPVKLSKKPTRADPRIFACDWPGPQSKDFNLAEIRAKAQSTHLPEHLPTPPLKLLPFHLWKEDQANQLDPPCCKWTNTIIPVPDSSLPSDLIIGLLSLGQRHAMSVCLQVFTKHCFSGEYSQRMRPTASDATTCPCTYTQTPIPMSELDQNGNPQPKVEGD